jgi:hypothetical protein
MSVRITITAGGVFDGNGKEVPVGTTLTVKKEPVAWAGRYEVTSGDDKGKTAVTNDGLKAEHHGGGKFNITKGEEVLLQGLSKADADAFNALSDDDKAAFVADQAKA